MEEIIKILNEIRPEENFENSSDFIEEGLLDSFDVVNLVSRLDQTFKISIDGVDILPKNFKNVESIMSLIRKNGAAL